MKFGIIHWIVVAALALAVPSAFAQYAAGPVEIQRAGSSYLGIAVLEITPERAKALNLKEERGVEVTHLEPNSPAAKAGIKEGDVVLEYNGEPVEGTEQFVRLVRETPVGRHVKMVVWRNGANQNLTATIEARRSTVFQTPQGPFALPNFRMPGMPPIEIPRFQMSWQNPILGIEGESMGQEPQLAAFFGVKEGVLVKSVIPNSAAEKSGIKAGDVITKVNDSSVASTRDITNVLRSNRSKPTFPVTVMRNKKEIAISVTLPDSGAPRATEPPRGDNLGAPQRF